MSIPYHPDTDAVPDMTDHRVASLRARLAAAEAREARLVGALTVARDKFAEYCSLHLEKGTPEATAKAMTNRRLASMCATALACDPSALAQAIEGVLASPGLRTDAAPDLHGVALVNEIARLMGDLEARVAVLRREWGQR